MTFLADSLGYMSSYMKMSCQKYPIININFIKIIQQELNVDYLEVSTFFLLY